MIYTSHSLLFGWPNRE